MEEKRNSYNSYRGCNTLPSQPVLICDNFQIGHNSPGGEGGGKIPRPSREGGGRGGGKLSSNETSGTYVLEYSWLVSKSKTLLPGEPFFAGTARRTFLMLGLAATFAEALTTGDGTGSALMMLALVISPLATAASSFFAPATPGRFSQFLHRHLESHWMPSL